ncbi:response regulator [Magnetospira thiophila]
MLVVDDDAHVRELVKSVLSGYGIDTVLLESGVGLAQRVRAEEPDAILLDYQMPDLDGLSVLRELRAARILDPVIIMTANADQNTAVQFFRSGANDFLPKPFDLEYLAIIVQRTINHHSRNLLGSVAKLSQYATHKDSCEHAYGTCTCGFEETVENALGTVMAAIGDGR